MSEKKLLIITVAAVAVVLLACGGLAYLFWSEHSDIQQQIAEVDAKIKDREDKDKQNKKWEEFFQSDTYTKGEGLFKRQLPMESPTADTEFWQHLNGLRRGLNILIRKVEGVQERAGQGGFAPPAGVRKMYYRVEMRGRFYDIVEYLSLIENDDRVARVEHFLIKRKQSTSQGADAAQEEVLVDATVRIMGFEYASAAPKP
jgi:hypothetical protein